MLQKNEVMQKTQLEDSKREKNKIDWMADKEHLQNQVRFLQNQMNENKSLNNGLLSALQQGLESNNEGNMAQLYESNKNLQMSLQRLVQTNKSQEVKLKKYRHFKQVYTHIDSGVCSKCKQSISLVHLLPHLAHCKTKNNHSTDHLKYQNLIQLHILSAFVKQDAQGLQFVQYILELNDDDRHKRLIYKKFEDIITLY